MLTPPKNGISPRPGQLKQIFENLGVHKKKKVGGEIPEGAVGDSELSP